jgi:hypothetical protein
VPPLVLFFDFETGEQLQAAY